MTEVAKPGRDKPEMAQAHRLSAQRSAFIDMWGRGVVRRAAIGILLAASKYIRQLKVLL